MELKSIQGMDKRKFPRVEFDAPIFVSGEVVGELINLSEGGVCVMSPDSVKLERCSITIDFPGRNVPVNAEVKWREKLDSKDMALFGADMIDVDEKDLVFMRKYMITSQFKYVIGNISDSAKRKSVLGFARHFRDYLFDLTELRDSLKKGKADREEILSRVSAMTDDIVVRGEELKKELADEKLISEIKKVFRNLASSWAFNSRIVYRGFEKPKGYPGDFETLEIIYDERIISSEDELGFFFDVYFLNNPYAKAVRERKNKLREIVEDVLREKEGKISILNLACGACKEIRDICSDPSTDLDGKEVFFYCLDWDREALDFSREKLKNAPVNLHLEFMEENVLNFIRRKGFYDKVGKQDLIYSIGLADYFTDRILKTMIGNAFYGLKKGGSFVIAHKDKDISFSHLPPEWFCDWTFYQRNEKDVLDLIKSVELEGVKISSVRDKTGDIFFFILTKI